MEKLRGGGTVGIIEFTMPSWERKFGVTKTRLSISGDSVQRKVISSKQKLPLSDI